MRRVSCKSDDCRKWANLNDDGLCPKCVTNAADTNEDCAACFCKICKQEVKDEETKAIGCDLCKNWFHPKCVSNNDAILQLLDTVTTEDNLLGCLLWLCPDCMSKPRDIKIDNGSCEPSVPI